jgi:transposase InsO family protein
MIIKSELNIKFEFTAPGTPQQNGKVERAFATLFGKTRSMLNAARITIPLGNGLWENCAKLSVQLENIIVKDKD